MYELCYTSAPKGIRPGSSGYTTVAHTKDLPTALLQRLEGLSKFDHVDKNAAAYANNPVNHAHLTFGSGQQRLHVISRIAACEPDHSGRTNYFAHHAVVSEPESRGVPAGPVAFAADGSLFKPSWSGEPRLLAPRQPPAVAERGRADGPAWKAAGLDSGWAEYLADRVQQRGKPLYVIYPRGTDVLALMADVVAAVPIDQRWGVTFATHATAGFPGLGVDCQVRFVLADTPYAAEVGAQSRAEHCIDLTKRPVAPAVVKRESAVAGQVPPGQRPPAAGRGDRPGGGSTGRRPDEQKDWFPVQPSTGGVRPGIPAPDRIAQGSTIATWALGAVAFTAILAALGFAYKWSEARSQIGELSARLEQREDRISKLEGRLKKTEDDARKPADREPAQETSGPTEAAAAIAPAPARGGQEPVAANAEPPRAEGQPQEPTREPGGDDHPKEVTPPPEPAKTHTFADVAEGTSKADKANGRGWETILVSGLGKDDQVDVSVGGHSGVVGCEVIRNSALRTKWEIKENNGDKRLLATIVRKGADLQLKVNEGPKSDLLAYVTFVVDVTPAGAKSPERREFLFGKPIAERFHLVPERTATEDDPYVQSCGSEFRIFEKKETREWFARILAADPALELTVTFDGTRLKGGVERDGKAFRLVVKRLQSKDGKQSWKLDAREVCGIVLDLPDPDAKASGIFKLNGFWIQNPAERIGPSLDAGIRLPVNLDEKKAVDELQAEFGDAKKAFDKANKERFTPGLDERGKQEAEARYRDADKRKIAAEQALDACKANFNRIRLLVTKMSLGDFQEVPVRMTLRRPDVAGEIAIVDSLGPR